MLKMLGALSFLTSLVPDNLLNIFASVGLMHTHQGSHLPIFLIEHFCVFEVLGQLKGTLASRIAEIAYLLGAELSPFLVVELQVEIL